MQQKKQSVRQSLASSCYQRCKKFEQKAHSAELRSLWERREYVEPTGDVARLLSDQAKEDNDDQKEEEPRSTIATRKARNRGQSGGGKKRHEL